MELLKIKPKKATLRRKKKPRKVKHNLTLSEAEIKQLTRVCKKDGTTPARLIKSVLRDYLKDRNARINDEIAENQLNLFKNPQPVQFKIED
jgi:hypothetical protein